MKTLICLSTLALLALFASPIHAQENHFLIWVFDQGSANSQFGYYNGTNAVDVGGVFKDYDVEGLACLQNVIYGTSGHDGQRSSELFTISIDAAANQTTLTKVGDLESSDHQPYFEVAALAEKSDGTLWGYADDGSQRGIIQINPSTAVAEMVQPAPYKVEGIEWLGETLWLVGNTQFYTWTPGGEITKAFKVASAQEIEALDVIDGLLWVNLAQNNLTMLPIDPATGQIVPGGFKGHPDIESLTYCQLTPPLPPTPLPTATSTPSPTATPTALPTVTITPSPVSSATATQTVTPAVSRTATPTPTTTPTATASITGTHTPTPNATPSPLATTTPLATATATPIRTTTPSVTPIARTTPFGPTPELTPAIPTNETDDDEPFMGYAIFLPISHR